MYCRTCEYELVNLVGGLCPECGQGFDPADPTTFDPTPRETRRLRLFAWFVYGAASVPLLSNALLSVSALVARGVLGHWPRAMTDDPKSIPYVNWLHVGAVMLLLLSLPSGLLTLGLLAGAAYTRIRRAVRTCAFAISLYGAGVILFFWDPAKLWLWVFD
jgi:hypothetical protein